MTEQREVSGPAKWTMGFMADGRSEVTWTPTEEMANPVGNAHGGMVAALVDDVAGMALISTFDSFVGAPTVSLRVDYLHAMPIGATYTARGEIMRRGKATAVVDVNVYDLDERLMARGTCFFQLPGSERQE